MLAMRPFSTAIYDENDLSDLHAVLTTTRKCNVLTAILNMGRSSPSIFVPRYACTVASQCADYLEMTIVLVQGSQCERMKVDECEVIRGLGLDSPKYIKVGKIGPVDVREFEAQQLNDTVYYYDELKEPHRPVRLTVPDLGNLDFKEFKIGKPDPSVFVPL